MSKSSIYTIVGAIDWANSPRLYEIRLLPDLTVTFVTRPLKQPVDEAWDVDDWLQKNGTG